MANGADAIYFGMPRFNARLRADNFTEEDLPQLMAFLHQHGVRGYCAFNTLIFTGEIEDAEKQLKLLESAGVDAVFHSGFPPAEGPGPVINISGTGAMITGGSAIRTVSSPTAFTSIVVGVEGVLGYWELTLPTAVTAEELILTLSQSIPEATFNVDFALASTGGVGNFSSTSNQRA